MKFVKHILSVLALSLGLGLVTTTVTTVAPQAVGIETQTAEAAAGCNNGNGVYSNYFYELGVLMPHTFTITCTSQVPTGGWKVRYHVFCQYTDKWTGWVQFLNQSKSASCGLGEGGITSVSPQFVQV